MHGQRQPALDLAPDFLKTLKNAVDPLNVLAPGRYGINA
jgi:FAD/FMN-containing dehydrogenase